MSSPRKGHEEHKTADKKKKPTHRHISTAPSDQTRVEKLLIDYRRQLEQAKGEYAAFLSIGEQDKIDRLDSPKEIIKDLQTKMTKLTEKILETGKLLTLVKKRDINASTYINKEKNLDKDCQAFITQTFIKIDRAITALKSYQQKDKSKEKLIDKINDTLIQFIATHSEIAGKDNVSKKMPEMVLAHQLGALYQFLNKGIDECINTTVNTHSLSFLFKPESVNDEMRQILESIRLDGAKLEAQQWLDTLAAVASANRSHKK